MPLCFLLSACEAMAKLEFLSVTISKNQERLKRSSPTRGMPTDPCRSEDQRAPACPF